MQRMMVYVWKLRGHGIPACLVARGAIVRQDAQGVPEAVNELSAAIVVGRRVEVWGYRERWISGVIESGDIDLHAGNALFFTHRSLYLVLAQGGLLDHATIKV